MAEFITLESSQNKDVTRESDWRKTVTASGAKPTTDSLTGTGDYTLNTPAIQDVAPHQGSAPG
jgi:hypothetical protein